MWCDPMDRETSLCSSARRVSDACDIRGAIPCITRAKSLHRVRLFCARPFCLRRVALGRPRPGRSGDRLRLCCREVHLVQLSRSARTPAALHAAVCRAVVRRLSTSLAARSDGPPTRPYQTPHGKGTR
jgi:hypothetical protein